MPPDGALLLRFTVHASVAAPVRELAVHVNEDIAGRIAIVPVPLSAIAGVWPAVALLVIVSVPDKAPLVVGSNCTVSEAAWFGFSVSGKLIPDAEKLVPETAIELIVSGAFPVEVSVNDCADLVFTFTLPNVTLFALVVRAAFEPVSCRANVWETPFALAVKVTACAFVTAATVAVKLALVAPAATVTTAGTVTALLLLARLTANPPLAAAALIVTEQLSLTAPVSELLLQVNSVNAGTPVPLRLTVAEPPVDELLERLSDPLCEPATVGSNCTVRAAV